MPLIDAEPYEFALEPMRAALVIIDMQRDFLEPGGFGQSLGDDVSLLRRTIAPTRRLLDAARAVGLMVIHTREGHRADLADLPPAKKARGRPSLAIGEAGAMGRLLVRGEPGHDIVPSCIRSRASRSSPRSKRIAGRGEPDARRARWWVPGDLERVFWPVHECPAQRVIVITGLCLGVVKLPDRHCHRNGVRAGGQGRPPARRE